MCCDEDLIIYDKRIDLDTRYRLLRAHHVFRLVTTNYSTMNYIMGNDRLSDLASGSSEFLRTWRTKNVNVEIPAWIGVSTKITTV